MTLLSNHKQIWFGDYPSQNWINTFEYCCHFLINMIYIIEQDRKAGSTTQSTLYQGKWVSD